MSSPSMTLALSVLCLAVVTRPLSSQPPATDIYVGRLAVRDGRIAMGQLRNITSRDGYDNQPHFTPDGQSVLYTSIREDGQADTYRFDLASGSLTRVTRTSESEYSPTIMPTGTSFSAVRVESDSTQRLWQFDLDGRPLGLVLEDVKPVGYHAWATESTVALYVLGPPSTLRMADLLTGRSEIIAESIGRSLHAVPGRRAISYVQQTPDAESWIVELDLETMERERLVRTVPGNEFHAWTPGGTLLMGSGSRLYQWTRGQGDEWVEVADLGSAGITGITRLAVSPNGDRIAIVASHAGT